MSTMSTGTKSTEKLKSTTPERGGIVGKKRGKASGAGASARPVKKNKKTAVVVGETYATTCANLARTVFGPTYNETELEQKTKTLRTHKNLVKAQYESCKNMLVISRSHNRDLEEKLACTELELAVAKKSEAALKKDIHELYKANKKLEQGNTELGEALMSVINGLRAEKSLLVQTSKDLGEANKKLEEENHELEYTKDVLSRWLRHYKEIERQKKAASRCARMLE